MFKRGSIALLISLAACGGSTTIGGPDPSTGGDDDTNPGSGSNPTGGVTPTVTAVACPASTMPLVTAPPADDASGYTPNAVTIPVGGMVQFQMPPEHNVSPNPIKPSDPGIHVDFGGTTCLQFAKAGTYSFLCTTHSFAGTVTVQ